ncbi:MAG: DUF92 domain-containing protein [Chloroflexi bacterium]|nr:DUF92 domain-containing protein [Chloroflexota bacterium]
MQLLIGSLTAILIAILATRAGSLSRSGGLAAALIGTMVFGLGGWQWAILLLAFFITSSLLTRAFKKRKSTLEEKFAKGGKRDAGQVLANGGVAAICAALGGAFPAASWTWWLFAAALAAVNADTWATELGVLNRTEPRLITNGRPVERGTSGGISWAGTLAALAGSGLIAVLAVMAAPEPFDALPSWQAFGLLAISGLLGSLFDSLLGATIQAIYHCPQCDKETERHPLHLCGTATSHLRGWKWLDNDFVNLACSLAGVFVMTGSSLALGWI